MIATPWGDVGTLDRLSPATAAVEGRSAALAARPPRQRLFAAVVAGCAQVGYENLTVSDILALSGVSRATFYEHFDNKTACFVATLDAVLEGIPAEMAARFKSSDGPEAGAREALRSLLARAEEQPAAARLCLVESYAAGDEALERMRSTLNVLATTARRTLERSPDPEGPGDGLHLAVVGGLHRILFNRLIDGGEPRLVELTDQLSEWALSYRTPPQRLRLRRRKPKLIEVRGVPPFAALDPAENIIRSFTGVVAEKGYRNTTIADICARASISQRTFYEYFEGKPALLDAALDSTGMQVVAATLPAIRRSPGWPHSVRAGLGACCRLFAAEPELAWLRSVEVYAIGPHAMSVRDLTGMAMFAEVYADERALEIEPLVLEASLGAMYTVLHEIIRSGNLEDLLDAPPLLTYIALNSILGAEVAAEVANGDDV